MDALYRRNGGAPAALPFGAYDARNDWWSDLPNNPDGRQACGFVLAPPVPPHDGATHRADWDAAAQAWVITPRPPPLPPTPAELLAYASTAHAALRDGGVTLPTGIRVKTDAESRGLIGGAYSLTDVKPDATIDFKAATGWVQIDAATMQTVAIAVGSWVQACYSAWRQVEAGIAAGTLTTTAQIDAAFAAVIPPG